MLTRANALGWAPFEELTATQMNHIDSQLPSAADFDAGGNYAPTANVHVDAANGGNIVWDDDDWPGLDSRGVLFQNPLTIVDMTNLTTQMEFWANRGAATDWTSDLTHFRPKQLYTNAASRPVVTFECTNVPESCLIKAAGALLYHPTAGSDPSLMPIVSWSKQTLTVGSAQAAPASLGTASPSASYRGALRAVEVAITPQALNNATHRYLIAVSGEAGTGVAAGLLILGVYLKADVTSMRY